MNLNTKKMNGDKIVNAVYLLFFMGLAAFALYYCFGKIDYEKFLNSLKSADYRLVAISATTGVVATFVRALRWRIMMEPIGYRPSIFNTYNALMVGYMANLAVPRIGELIRCTTLNKTNKIPVNSLFGTVVTERILDFLCLIVLLILTLFLKMELFVQLLNEKIFPQWQPMYANISTKFIVTAATAIIVVFVCIYFLLKHLLKKNCMRKIKKLLTGLLDGLKSIFRMKDRLPFIAYTAVIWICYWLGGYLVFKSLPVTAHFTVADGLFFLSLGTLGWVVPSPGGFGTFHTIVAWGLMMYGLNFEDGISVATLSHESQLLGMIVFGLASLVFASLNKKGENINFKQQI